MSGELAPLPEIVALKTKYRARLLVDDAHGTGVLGDNGRGTPEYFGVEDEVDLHGGTFAKSFGTFGGYMCGPKNVIEFMRFQSQGYVLTKALPAAITAATIKTLELIQACRKTRLGEPTCSAPGARASISNPRGAVALVWAAACALPRSTPRAQLASSRLVLGSADQSLDIRVFGDASPDVQRVIDAFAEIHRARPSRIAAGGSWPTAGDRGRGRRSAPRPTRRLSRSAPLYRTACLRPVARRRARLAIDHAFLSMPSARPRRTGASSAGRHHRPAAVTLPRRDRFFGLE
jgi:hypothetical protein